MSKEARSLRRHHERRIQRRRSNYFKWIDFEKYPRRAGALRHGHFGCGCPMCKPHKHRIENKYKPSELAKLDFRE